MDTKPHENIGLDEYERHFDRLAGMATDLNIPVDEAESLIEDVILSTLAHPPSADIATWITAAFTAAVNRRGGRT